MERTGCPGLRRSGCTHLPPRRPLPPHRAGASQRASSTAVHALRTQSSTSGLINAGVAQPALRARGDVARTPSSTAIQAQTDAARAWEEELEEILKLTSLLPTSVRALVEEHPQMPELIEVRQATCILCQSHSYSRKPVPVYAVLGHRSQLCCVFVVCYMRITGCDGPWSPAYRALSFGRRAARQRHSDS